MRLFASALFAALAACSTLPPAAAPIVEPKFSAERIDQDIRALSSDAFEGRGTATPGEAKTVTYLIERFRDAGMVPGGDMVGGERQWTQRVPLRRSAMVGTPTASLSTGGKVEALGIDKAIALRAPLNGSSTIRFNEAPLLFVGYGVTAPERQWDDFKGADVRGKVLVMLVNDPDFEGPVAGPGFGGKAMTYYGRWTYKYEEAARRGAAGVLIVHEDAPASYGWQVIAGTTEAVFDIDSAGAPRRSGLEGWIHADLAERLFKASGSSLAEAKAAARTPGFQPIELKPRLNVDATAELSRVPTHNVAALLPGAARPDEVVIYTAHYDHLGIGEPDADGDRIYNGALDNGTGTAALVEQARAFAAAPRPQRSILFLAVGAEEMGLLGSSYYASAPLFPLAKTVGVLNTDMILPIPPARDFSISGLVRMDLLDMLIEEGAKLGRSFTPDPNPGAGGFFRSDHFSFAKAGVPAVSIKNGLDLIEGGTERGKALAGAVNRDKYHKPSDEWAPGWDYRGLIGDLTMLHRIGQRLANSRSWPNWSLDSEFRATRDRTAAERQ